MKKLTLHIFNSLLLIGIANNACAEGYDNLIRRHCAEVDKGNNCTLYDVSIIELIANPERFDGKMVRVIGYMHLEFEGDAIYLSKQDFENRIYKNGVWVDFNSVIGRNIAAIDAKDHYVLIEGIFSRDRRGHFNMWSGTIEKIRRLVKW